jgi:hypothetical protein
MSSSEIRRAKEQLQQKFKDESFIDDENGDENVPPSIHTTPATSVPKKPLIPKTNKKYSGTLNYYWSWTTPYR